MFVIPVVFFLAAGGVGGVGGVGGADGVEPDYRREIGAWQKTRDSRLRADGGWLTLAGLFWLKPGTNTFGADVTNDIVLPSDSSPPRAGVFTIDQQKVIVTVAPGVPVLLWGKPVTPTAHVLRSDTAAAAARAAPDVLTLGSLTMQVIERHGRLGIRLKDAKSKTRREFKGLRYYPVSPRYRVVAQFIAHPKATKIMVPDVLGESEPLPSPGYAQFDLAGKTFRLDPIIEVPGSSELFFIFRDQTAGRTTYGAGRFLYADAPKDGRIVLDFNKAYSPPCAFTPFATCPLPPDQNRLPVPIEAGELFDPHH